MTEIKTEAGRVECELARRLHAAAIAKGKAEAEIERTPLDGRPVALRVRALAGVAQATIDWLLVYFEGVEYFRGKKDTASGLAAPAPSSPVLNQKAEVVMTDLLALAERVLEAKGPDRLLDNLIWVAQAPDDPWLIGHEEGRFPQKPIYGTRADMLAWLNGADGHALDGALPSELYTTSLDAAMTLVPSTWKFRQMNFSAPCADDRKWHLNLHGGREGGDIFVGRGATPALALVSAALRAHHALICGDRG